MREILFRGKRKDNGGFVEGFLFKTKEHTYIAFAEQYDDDLFLAPKNIFIEVDAETVGQYTGMTDKKGNKIFEGDIVKFIHKGKWKKSEISPFGVEVGEPYSRNYKIEYVNTFARYGLRFINGSIHFPCKQSTLLMYDCKVIGNIHDNPELLKGDNDNA